MDEVTRLQRRWLDAARRRQAPPADAIRRMRNGLRARIEAGEPAPALLPEDTDEPARALRWRPWLMGSAGLLAAAALLLWASRSTTPQRARADDPTAARYDARGKAGAVAPRRSRAPSSTAGPRSKASSPPDPSPDLPTAPAIASPPAVDPPTPVCRARPHRGPESKRVPPASFPSAIPSDPSTRTPVALDVAGEAAVLRRVKVAIEQQAWTRADATLDEYARAHPQGILAPEARALRVVVACRRGSSNASSKAARFLKRHPTSPLRDRIRGACGIDP